MPTRIRTYTKFFVAAFLLVSFCLIEADAQTRRKRSRRSSTRPAAPKPVITNPPITPPSETTAATTTQATGDVKIISTADGAEPAQDPEPTASPARKDPNSVEKEDMQRTISTLSGQVNRLNDKLSQMNEDDRYHLDMERLTRAEQRAEQLRGQLFDTETKMADIEAKLEQLEYALKPENIERATQSYGSTRPEEAREARRRQLESERNRARVQFKLLETSKARLEVAVANADSEVDLLRAKLQQKRDMMDSQPANNEGSRESNRRPRKPE